jgi:hypothetical protein
LPVRPAAVLAPNPTRGQLLLAQASNAPVKTAEREPQQTAGDDRDAESQPGSEEAAPEDAAEEHTPGGLENLVERVNVASDQLEKHWAPVLKGLKDAMVMPGDQAAKLLDSLQTSVSKLEKLAENMKQAHKRFAESQEDGTRADGADKPATAPDAPA